MRVLLDLRPLQTGSAARGIGTYVRGIAIGLATLPEIELCGLALADLPLPSLPADITIHSIRRNCTAWRLRSWVEESCKLAGEVNRIAPDVYHHTTQFIPPRLPKSTVITIHDAIPVIHPQGVSRVEKLLFLLGYWGLHAACHILTVSEVSRHDVSKTFRLNPEKLTIVHCGINQQLIPHIEGEIHFLRLFSSLGLSPPYVVYAGGGEQRKDMPFLLQAFKITKTAWSDLRLLIVGREEYHHETRKLAAELGLASSVVFSGFVDDTALATIYAQAFAYLQPAKYEGFGLPPLEAMSLGCPVISRRNSSLPEILGDDATFLDQDTPQDMARLILHLRNDSTARTKSKAYGLARALRFTWERSAEHTAAVYRRVVTNG